jgi:Mn-dependent DtxR family transcriptional regulator
LEMSPSTVQLILKDMIEQGLIEVAPGISRGVVITGSNMKHGEVAL